MRRLLTLLVLLPLAGCTSAHMGVQFERADSTPVEERVELPLPVRLGVRTPRQSHPAFHSLVLESLRTNHNFAQVDSTMGHDDERHVDFVVELEYGLETGARWYNFFTMFPGSALFAPSWAQLHWDFDVTSHLTLYRSNRQVGTFQRRDEFDLAYTSPGYHVVANIGWGALLFPPCLASPLLGGVVAALDGGQAREYQSRFFMSAAARAWADRVANLIAAKIETNLGPPGRPFKPPPRPRKKTPAEPGAPEQPWDEGLPDEPDGDEPDDGDEPEDDDEPDDDAPRLE